MKRISIQFSPSLLPAFATVLLISLFTSLGLWQLQRAEETKDFLEQSMRNQSQAMIALPLEVDKKLESLRYRHVFFFGMPLNDKQFLLDNQVRNKLSGTNVLTPFKLDGGKLILVDRGWIEFSRESMPDVTIPEQAMRVEGHIYTSAGKPFSLGEMDEGTSSWPRLITHIDYATMEQRLHASIAPLTVRMNANNEYGFLRQWPELTRLNPNRNIAYAIQWFGLALAVLIIFLVLNFKFRRNKPNT